MLLFRNRGPSALAVPNRHSINAELDRETDVQNDTARGLDDEPRGSIHS